jgi:Copper type II ascorbate-dependent monooxygenase, N-terminal domain/DOMON domain/Copper type II ascorbate-dependent monooxygenase, C-terminal domain
MNLAVALTCLLVTCQGVMSTMPDLYMNNDDFTSWMNNNGKSYNFSKFLNTTGGNTGVGLFWTVDLLSKVINLAVACPIGKGWCGFGIADAGGMKGADMLIFETENKVLYDSYVLEDISRGPIRDDCQNWILKDSTVSSDSTSDIIIFEAQRDLDTQDSFDRALIDDSDLLVTATRVIAAWGESSTVSYHGQNVARTSVRFFANTTSDNLDDFEKLMASQSEGSFVLRATNFSIPETETFYAHFCFTYNDLVAMGVPKDADLHIVGVTPVVTKETNPYVHHFILSGSSETNENETSPIPMEYCNTNLTITEISYVWAPGEESFAYPSYLGGPLGMNGFRTFKLEVHYNNPTNTSNLVDSSGVRLYWTTKKRQYDLGVLQLGDPILSLYGEGVGSGVTEHSFDCPSSCTTVSVSTPLTVVREYIHMHKTGVMGFNKLSRNGTVVHTGAAEFYDFAQQGNQAIQQPEYQILPGDSFNTRCFFDATDETWGLGSQNEMCIRLVQSASLTNRSLNLYMQTLTNFFSCSVSCCIIQDKW